MIEDKINITLVINSSVKYQQQKNAIQFNLEIHVERIIPIGQLNLKV